MLFKFIEYMYSLEAIIKYFNKKDTKVFNVLELGAFFYLFLLDIV